MHASLRNLVLLSEFGYFFSCCREMKRAIFIIIHLMSSVLFARPTLWQFFSLKNHGTTNLNYIKIRRWTDLEALKL